MAILYCGPTSAGGNTGADFTNRIALPDTTGFTRTNEYVYIGSATDYGGRTLSTPVNGAQTITIRKANAAQDSGVAGWSSTFESTKATFGEINPKTGYWIWNGVSRIESATWADPTNRYGTKLSGVTASSLNGDNARFSQFRYLDIGAAYAVNPSAGTINGYGVVINLIYDQTDITFSHCAIHNYKQTGLQGSGLDNLTVEYCEIGPGWGKEALRGGNTNISSGWIVRYNKFWQASQTDPNDGSSGITAEIGIWDWTGTATGHEIYGNVFYNDKSGGRNACIVVGGNGGSWVGGGADGTLVYNNTFAGMPEAGTFGMVDLNGNSTVARNNLFYDTAGTSISASTSSNNSSTADIFTDATNQDYTLTSNTAAGFTLSAPYDEDMNGIVRGSGGEDWSLGAFQFNGDPPPPGDVTVNTTNLVITGTLTIG